MSYLKPSIVEIFSEISLKPNTLPQVALFELVPELKNNGFTEIELAEVSEIAVNPLIKTVLQKKTPRIHCFNKDKTSLVQLSEDFVIVNQRGEYLGWNIYRKIFDLAVASLQKIRNPLPVSSLSLRVQDEFTVPRKGFALGKYLNCGGPRIPSWYANKSDACDITLGLGFLNESGYNKVLNIRVRPKVEEVRIQIESGFQNTLKDTDNPGELIEALHDESNETFESLMTDTTRKDVLGGER